MRKIVFFAVLSLLSLLLCGCRTTHEDPNVTESVIRDGEMYTIFENGELKITDGETLYVEGKMLCHKGGRITVEQGGSLMINGELELAGELFLDGFLGISENASVYGEGSASINSFNDIYCEGSFTAKIIPPRPVITDGVTSVGGVVIVNKKIPISKEYGRGLDWDVISALNKMRKESGYEMKLISGFRSYDTQVDVYKNWCERDGVEAAETYSSRPGHSEHQTGLTVDVTNTEEEYAYTDEGRWIAANCYKYGFVIRYPKGKESVTGYTYEPWHLRYLGKSTAKLVFDSGLTLEEFLGVEGGGYYQSSADFMMGLY